MVLVIAGSREQAKTLQPCESVFARVKARLPSDPFAPIYLSLPAPAGRTGECCVSTAAVALKHNKSPPDPSVAQQRRRALSTV